jgi:cell division protein FtsB
VRAAIPPAVFIAIAAYFAWSATQGDRGIEAFEHRKQLAETASGEFARAQAEQKVWEKRVDGLRATHVDRDALDERVRTILNRTDPSDIIVPWPQKDRLF